MCRVSRAVDRGGAVGMGARETAEGAREAKVELEEELDFRSLRNRFPMNTLHILRQGHHRRIHRQMHSCNHWSSSLSLRTSRGTPSGMQQAHSSLAVGLLEAPTTICCMQRRHVCIHKTGTRERQRR